MPRTAAGTQRGRRVAAAGGPARTPVVAVTADDAAGDAPAPPVSPTLRAFDLVAALARSDEPPSLDDLTRRADCRRPTVHRMLALLSAAGLALRDPVARGLDRGAAALRARRRPAAHLAAPGAARGGAARAVDEIGETCNYTMLDGDAVLYVARRDLLALRLHMEPGCRVPCTARRAASCSCRKMSQDEARRLLGATLPALHAAHALRATRRAVARSRADPVEAASAIDVGEYLEGSVCLAVPVLDAPRPAVRRARGARPRPPLQPPARPTSTCRHCAGPRSSLAAIATRQTHPRGDPSMSSPVVITVAITARYPGRRTISAGGRDRLGAGREHARGLRGGCRARARARAQSGRVPGLRPGRVRPRPGGGAQALPGQ